MADLLLMVEFRVRAYDGDVIGRRFGNVRNGHRFENWTPICEFEKKNIYSRYRCLGRNNLKLI